MPDFSFGTSRIVVNSRGAYIGAKPEPDSIIEIKNVPTQPATRNAAASSQRDHDDGGDDRLLGTEVLRNSAGEDADEHRSGVAGTSSSDTFDSSQP